MLSFTRRAQKLIRSPKPFYCQTKAKIFTVVIDEKEDLHKSAHLFYDKFAAERLKTMNKTFRDISIRDLQSSEMKLTEITEPILEMPFLEEFKKHGLDVAPDITKQVVKNKDYAPLIKALEVAYDHFSQYQYIRVIYHVLGKIPKVTPIVEPGMRPLEQRYDAPIREVFIRQRLRYALKTNEKPYFAGEYMNKLGEKIAKQNYKGEDLKKLGYSS